MKKLAFYIVSQAIKDKDILCSIVCSKDEAREYILNKTILANFEHYSRWCELKELNPKSFETKAKYIQVVQPESETYKVKKILFTQSGLASILRMFNGCIPVGAKYETGEEILYIEEMYKNYLNLEAR